MNKSIAGFIITLANLLVIYENKESQQKYI